MTLSGRDAPELVLRFGMFAEQQYFTGDARSLYDAILFKANLAQGKPAGLATLVIRAAQPFLIDPITHAFGHSPEKIKQRDSDGILAVPRGIRALAETYGAPVAERVGLEAVWPEDLSDPRTREGFCRSVVEFQLRTLEGAVEGDKKYMDDDAPALTPRAVFAPYFFMDASTAEDWLPINIALINTSAEILDQRPVAHICMSRDVLERKEMLDDLVTQYCGSDLGSAFVWVSKLPETEATAQEIKQLRGLVSGLANGGTRPVYIAHGGYLAAMLSFDGLSGFCHGPGYGEEREVTPVGGGLPQPKYYFTPLRKRINWGRVNLLIQQMRWTAEDFHANVCDCETCVETLEGDIANFERFGEVEERTKEREDGSRYVYTFSTESTKRCCNFHYLRARRREIDDIRMGNREQLLALLRDAGEPYRRTLGPEEIAHLRVWHDALTDDS